MSALDDIKTYSSSEAKAEWDGAREAKRRMFLARVNLRESDIALKSWGELDAGQRKLIHGVLNEDFFSPIWYINTKGQRINKVYVPPTVKSSEQLAYEAGEKHWEKLSHKERFSALLHNGIGRDADQGQFTTWGSLSPDLRDLLVRHFAGTADAKKEPAAVVEARPAERPQLELF